MRAIVIVALIALTCACSRDEVATTEVVKTETVSVKTSFGVEVAQTMSERKLIEPGVYEPLRGDPERKALLDLVRPKVAGALGVPVEFKVDTLRVAGDWGFAVLEPVRPGGAPLTILDTKLKDEEGEWDGLRTEAIWRKENGAWLLKEYAIGATDVWYEPFCDTAPNGLIPICANRAPKP